MSKTKFDVLSKKFSLLSERMEKNLTVKVKALSEQIAGAARKNCPVDTGSLRNSIESFVEETTDKISGGAVTTHEYAAFVEFGTGPTGTNVKHPLEGELEITRKTQPWRGKIPITPENESKFKSLTEQEKEQGFAVRFVSGQEPIPFMYKAMKENEKEILKEFSTVAELSLNYD